MTRGSGIGVWLLIVWTLGVVSVTLYPFDFSATPSPLPEAGEILQYGPSQMHSLDFVLNLLLFIPLGALLHDLGRRRSLRLG